MHEFTTALKWLEEGHKTSLAVVLKTYGSAPRQVGSFLCVRDDGLFEGSVSGGCMEGDIIASAITGLKLGQAQSLHQYDNKSDAVWSATLACGSKIDIGIFSITPKNGECLREIINHKNIPQTITIDLNTGDFNRSEDMNSDFAELTNSHFTVPILPSYKLVIIGAVHIAQALAPMAITAGYDTIIVDPRMSFANIDRFKGLSLSHEWPDDYLQENIPDEQTALVTLTHDAKLDDAALLETLKSEAFYIGSLGSKKTHKARLSRLKEQGMCKGDLARIHGPVGLDIGGINPAEIAISIMAEITAIRRG